MNNLLILFIVCNIANVIIQTVKSIATIKSSPSVAAVVNALAYGFYTYVLIIISSFEISTIGKCLVVGACNLVGVYLVKKIEVRRRKEKLWKIEMTVPKTKIDVAHNYLLENNISHNYIPDIGKWAVFNIYCTTQEQTKNVEIILKECGGKGFVSESRVEL